MTAKKDANWKHVLGIVIFCVLFGKACAFCHSLPDASITHDQANCFRAMELVAEQEGWSESLLYRVIEEECR